MSRRSLASLVLASLLLAACDSGGGLIGNTTGSTSSTGGTGTTSTGTTGSSPFGNTGTGTGTTTNNGTGTTSNNGTGTTANNGTGTTSNNGTGTTGNTGTGTGTTSDNGTGTGSTSNNGTGSTSNNGTGTTGNTGTGTGTTSDNGTGTGSTSNNGTGSTSNNGTSNCTCPNSSSGNGTTTGSNGTTSCPINSSSTGSGGTGSTGSGSTGSSGTCTCTTSNGTTTCTTGSTGTTGSATPASPAKETDADAGRRLNLGFLCLTSDCGHKEALLNMPAAASLLFAPDGRLFTSGGGGVFEVTRDSSGAFHLVTLGSGAASSGLTLVGNMLYVADATGQQLLGAHLDAPEKMAFRPVRALTGARLAGGVQPGTNTVRVAGDRLLFADSAADQVTLTSLDGQVLLQSAPGVFRRPSSALLGQPPMFKASDILVTEQVAPGGSVLAVFRRDS